MTDWAALCRAAASRSEDPRADPLAALILLGRIGRTVAARVDWIQIREKNLPARPLVELARGALALVATQAASIAAASPCGSSPPTASVPQPIPSTRILINDRLDVAVAAGAAGVHLGEESLPVAEVTRWRKEEKPRADFSVGASCHSLAAAVEAERAGADYIFFGPVFATPSKAAHGPPQGLEKLGEVCRSVRIPVLAIGGIMLENAATCLDSGAAGVAAIRLFQESADPAAVVEQIRTAR